MFDEAHSNINDTANRQAPDNGSTISNLWHAAYDEATHHPVVTALAATGAVLAAGAALYATRGRIAGLVGLGKTDVLLIEDTPAMGKAMKLALQEDGHNVTWLTGVKSAEPFTGLTPEGAEVPLAKGHWDVALVDGDLGKESLTGPEIVGPLKENHVLSVGTSTMDDFNAEMRANGAAAAEKKPIVFTSILAHRLNLTKGLLNNGEHLQEDLTAFKASFSSPEATQLRRRADEMVMRFIKEGA